jgi:NAD(P)-dependent dehydrogenase (short-subunit alcohol dehydrogenase family)
MAKFDAQGKVAVVTGAASGIGFAMVDLFGTEGMTVVLADLDADALEGAEKILRDKGIDAWSMPTDVSNPRDLDALAAAVEERYEGVDVLCNNAGIGSSLDVKLWDEELSDWSTVIAVNVMGVVHGVRSFVPGMLARGTPAHVINVASMSGLATTRGMGIYTATKHAIVGYSESLRFQLEGTNIRLAVLHPANTESNLNRERRKELMESSMPGKVPPMLPASHAADVVFDALDSDRFYLFTHPDSMDRIDARVANIRKDFESQPR